MQQQSQYRKQRHEWIMHVAWLVAVAWSLQRAQAFQVKTCSRSLAVNPTTFIRSETMRVWAEDSRVRTSPRSGHIFVTRCETRISMVLSRVSDTTATTSGMESTSPLGRDESPLLLRYAVELFSLIVFSVAIACLVITWEDLTCNLALPSRHRTSLTQLSPTSLKWGMATVHGMGFGHAERLVLLQDQQEQSVASTSSSRSSLQDTDDMFLANMPSYNEVMLRHRAETIPQWKQQPTDATIAASIHTVCVSLSTIWQLQELANDYQWDAIRAQLHQAPLTDLSLAASVLRQVPHNGPHSDGTTIVTSATSPTFPLRDVVGFDWGSCAWRHCGALADTQEALDELEQLLGVLEPYEAIFCLDVVERSLRDVLAVIPVDLWSTATVQSDDVAFHRNLPVYHSKVSFRTDSDDDGDSETVSRIDAAYFQALQDLRID